MTRTDRTLPAFLTVAVLTLSLTFAGCAPPSSSTAGAPTAEGSPSAGSQRSAATSEDVVSAEGAVVPHKQTNLSFKIGGRVSQISVAEGDAVNADQELARLETRDLEVAVQRAQASLKAAQAQLAKAKAGPRAEEVALAEAAVAIAEANVKAAEDTVGVATGNLAAARAALSSARASLEKLLAGPTQREIQIAEKQVEQAKNELWGLQRQRDVTRNTLEGQIAAAETAVAIADLQLEEVKAGARAEDIAVARGQVAEAEARVATAEAQLAQAQSQVEAAKAQVQQAQAQLDLVMAGTRPEDVIVAEAAVDQAEAAVAEARNALEDAVLRAPFAGTVGMVLLNEGELASPQVPVIRLGDLSDLQVQTEDLSEVDIHQVQVGQAARVTVDALGGQAFPGRVLRIEPEAGERRGDKVYTVTIELDTGQESGLRWGMTAFVEITTGS